MAAHDYRVTSAMTGEAGVSEWLEETKPQVWRKRRGFLEIGGAARAVVKPELLFSVCSWNCSAVNNNPYEYIIEFDEDPRYADLMRKVEAFLSDKESDVPVHKVFTDDMYEALAKRLQSVGTSDASLAAVARFWATLRDRPLLSGFLRDREIGKKRLVSMPDRVSNTVRTSGGGRMLRPTVINAYVDDSLGSLEAWWSSWLDFMFDRTVELPSPSGNDGSGGAGGGAGAAAPGSGAGASNNVKATKTTTVYAMLSVIKQAKYPAVTAEEEAVSIPLQTLYLAVFDAAMLHVVMSAAPDTWLAVKRVLTAYMVDGKDERLIRILEDTYSDVDSMCLQEVSVAMIGTLRGSSLGKAFHVVAPADASAMHNQNSVVLLRRSTFPEAGVEVTDEVRAMLKPGTLSPGDLILLLCKDTSGVSYLIASFHGDSDGKATLPVLAAISVVSISKHADAVLVLGMDANATTPETAEREGKLSWSTFLDEIALLALSTSFGPRPPATSYTSFLARSSLQGQLQKAVRYDDAAAAASKEPKDVILYRPTQLTRVKSWKDCTGDGAWREDAIMPATHFPSDHAILAAVFSRL